MKSWNWTKYVISSHIYAFFKNVAIINVLLFFFVTYFSLLFTALCMLSLHFNLTILFIKEAYYTDKNIFYLLYKHIYLLYKILNPGNKIIYKKIFLNISIYSSKKVINTFLLFNILFMTYNNVVNVIYNILLIAH